LYPIGGADGTHDLFLTVDTVGVGGEITAVTWIGVAPNAIKSFNTVAYTTSGLGTGIVVNVSSTGSGYSVAITPRGVDFQNGDTITVLGANIGGATPANNITITVNSVDPATGTIINFGFLNQIGIKAIPKV
jgi:hypothetical protein